MGLPEFYNGKNENALYLACCYGHWDIANLFLEKKLSLHNNKINALILTRVCHSDENVIFVKTMLSLIKLDQKTVYQLLIFNCKFKNAKIVHLLLETSSIDPNTADPDGTTPLVIAIGNEDPDITRILTRYYRTTVGLPNKSGITPLMHACKKGCLNVVTVLLKSKKTNINYISHRGMTALLYAVCANQVEIVQELLKHGSDPKMETRCGTALQISQAQNFWKITSVLKLALGIKSLYLT